MLIAIPSKGRAGMTTTQNILRRYGTFFVPENEVNLYRNINQVVGVPVAVRGITATRNWILDNADDEWVVFIDDDVKTAGWIQLNETRGIYKKMRDERFWIDEFVRAFDITTQMGWKVWGVKTESALRSTYPYKPLLFRTYVTASCMGIVNDGTYRFDESYPVKEDYEMCLRHIVEFGGILGIRYCHWQNEHWTTEGGCKDYRTIELERQAIKRLARQYPGMIQKAKRKANEFTISLNV
jgi:glycosyltransferase involved in cell wall biosynthesis